MGATPSGTYWALNENNEEVSLNFDTEDLGINIEYRFVGNIWVGVEAGVGGLRGLSQNDTNLQGPDFNLDVSPYISFSVNFRPMLNPDTTAGKR